MDNVEDQEKKDLAFLREQSESDKNIRGTSLALGSIPAGLVAFRLVQATRGYITNPNQVPGPGYTPPQLDPAFIFDLIKQLVDAEIQAFIQGFISLADLEMRLAQLSFVTIGQMETRISQLAFATINQVDAEIHAIVPNLIPAAQGLSKEAINALYGFDLTIAQEANSAISTIKNWINGFVDTWNSISIPLPIPFVDFKLKFPQLRRL